MGRRSDPARVLVGVEQAGWPLWGQPLLAAVAAVAALEVKGISVVLADLVQEQASSVVVHWRRSRRGHSHRRSRSLSAISYQLLWLSHWEGWHLWRRERESGTWVAVALVSGPSQY